MINRLLPAVIFSVSLISGAASADELTQIVQQDLVTLGYEPGNTDGEPTIDTAIAISKFQSENGLEVTGEATAQLAGIIKATISSNTPAAVAPAASVPELQSSAAAAAAAQVAAAPSLTPQQLQSAQQACLQQKIAEAQESRQRRRGLGRLARAFSRTASEVGGGDISREIAGLSSDVYTAGAIADDVIGAAEDLGLTESDVEACRNP